MERRVSERFWRWFDIYWVSASILIGLVAVFVIVVLLILAVPKSDDLYCNHEHICITAVPNGR